MKKNIACLILSLFIIIVGSSCYTEATNVSETIYVTEHGTKYHADHNCGNMKNPIEIAVEKAIKQGYTACKKCVK